METQVSDNVNWSKQGYAGAPQEQVNGTCPNCGYCSHCGRRNLSPGWVQPYPWYVPYTSPYTITCAGTQINGLSNVQTFN